MRKQINKTIPVDGDKKYQILFRKFIKTKSKLGEKTRENRELKVGIEGRDSRIAVLEGEKKELQSAIEERDSRIGTLEGEKKEECA